MIHIIPKLKKKRKRKKREARKNTWNGVRMHKRQG
jgi:hypothetical protein